MPRHLPHAFLPNYQAVLNNDSESVLVKGLRRFATHIRREHGLLRPTSSTSSRRRRLNPNSPNIDRQGATDPNGTKASDPVGRVGATDELEADSDLDDAGTDQEEEDGMEVVEEEEEEEAEAVGEGMETGGSGRTSSGNRDDPSDGDKEADMDEGLGARYATALLTAAEAGEAPGLLGEYLRGSPQVNDLLALWDLEARKVSGGLRLGKGWLVVGRRSLPAVCVLSSCGKAYQHLVSGICCGYQIK